MINPDATRQLGQALLNSELYNSLSAKDSENHAAQMAHIRLSGTGDDELSLRKENLRLKADLAQKGETLTSLFESVREKDALILEWMHSNESFKRLARQYGKKLGMTDEQRNSDFLETIVDVSEEDPKFGNTDFATKAKKVLGL